MDQFQSIATVLMSLFIGFIIGRGSKKSNDPRTQYMTQEEEARLRPKNKYIEELSDVHWDVLAAIKSGNKIQAIKLYRQHHSSSLKEAKKAIEHIINNL